MKLRYITSLSGRRINGFMRSAIIAARSAGFEFCMACNMDGADKLGYQQDCLDYGISVKHIPFDRNPLSFKNKAAYGELLRFMRENQFDVVHCNTPIGGLLGRVCAHKVGMKWVIYQAHGFHFWKGAPLKNWLCYYPVEHFLARFTDVLITINREDFACAQKFKLKSGGICTCTHGVGIDLTKFSREGSEDKMSVRKELEIPDDAFVMLGVGELIPRKNHIAALHAFAEANIQNSFYLICGAGESKVTLSNETQKLGISKQVRFLGFRRDVHEILQESDCFCFPSLQEGLPVALMEAMATGVLCIASRIRGNTDLLPESRYLFDPEDEKTLTELILDAYEEKCKEEEIQKNIEMIKHFSIETVVKEMEHIYEQICLKK